MNKRERRDEQRSALVFLLWGAGLLALPWTLIGVWALWVIPTFPEGAPESLAWMFYAYLIGSGIVSVVGAGLLMAAGVLYLSSESR